MVALLLTPPILKFIGAVVLSTSFLSLFLDEAEVNYGFTIVAGLADVKKNLVSSFFVFIKFSIIYFSIFIDNQNFKYNFTQ